MSDDQESPLLSYAQGRMGGLPSGRSHPAFFLGLQEHNEETRRHQEAQQSTTDDNSSGGGWGIIVIAIIAFSIFSGSKEKSPAPQVSPAPHASASSPKVDRPIFAKEKSKETSQGAASLPPHSTERRMRVNGSEELNVRAGPGTQFKVVGKLHENDAVLVSRTKGSWYFIGTGWIKSKFVIESE